MIAITLPNRTEDGVAEELFREFGKTVFDQCGMTIREFVTARAEFRNKLLYAEDGDTFSMSEDLDFLIQNIFSKTLRDLLWCLAVLLSNSPTASDWGLVSQFIGLYRKVLIESRVL